MIKKIWAIGIFPFFFAVSLLTAQSEKENIQKVKATLTNPEEAGFSSAKLNKLDEYFQSLVDDREIAGVVSLIARGDNVVFFQSYGYRNIEKGFKIDGDAIFDLQSMTKPFTSVAALMLYEEGHYDLDDPVSDYITELKNMRVGITSYDSLKMEYLLALVDAENEITIKQLLNHTAGFAARWNDGKIGAMYKELISKDYRNLTELVTDYCSIPLVHQPGTAFEYGVSTDILALLIERISKKSLDRFFHDRIFQPLEMFNTGYNVPMINLDRVVLNYYPENGELIMAAEQYTGERKTLFRGMGFVMSTAEDYFKFCQMILNNGLYKGKRLLKSSTIHLMTRASIGEQGDIIPWLPGYGFGLGFAIRTNNEKSEMLGNKGDLCWFGGANTAFWIDPKENIIGIVLMQSLWNERKISKKTRDFVYQALLK